jgi:hypothetical protein
MTGSAPEIFTVVSNLFLLIPFTTAVLWHRILRAIFYFIETFVSSFYHLCDAGFWCLFSFETLHFLDFFFAQSFILLSGLYLVDFQYKWRWLEWVLIAIGLLGIIILEIVLPGELYVQALIFAVVFLGVIIYWIVYASLQYQAFKRSGIRPKTWLPAYDWYMLYWGIALTALSIVLFASQEVYPTLYWLAHSLWHISASFGQHYLLQIKKPAGPYDNAAWKIKNYIIRNKQLEAFLYPGK